MKFAKLISITIATFLTTAALHAQAEGLPEIQARAKTRADEIMAAINADKQMKSTLIKSLEAAKSAYTRNGKAPSKEIAEADKVWMDYMKSYQAQKAGLSKDKVAEPAIVTKVLKDPCSAVLAKLKAKFSYIVEAFVSGPAGTNVCMIEPTSDFDQGDEPKWQKPWLEDMELFIENPERDVSTKEFTIKSSRLIKNEAGQKIGVLHIATVVK
jgi:hypothetical protein